MAALRAVSNNARPWAGVWSNQVVSGMFASLGLVRGGDCSSNCYPIGTCYVGLSKNRRLFPASFNLACRPCSSQPILSTPVKSTANFNHQLSFVPCTKDDIGVLNSVDFALAIHNHFEQRKGKSIRLLSVERASVIRSGFSIYNIILDGIDDQNSVCQYQFMVLHDPLLQKMKVIHQFPDPRGDSESPMFGDLCPWSKPRNCMRYRSTAASDVIIPVDHEDNELINKCAVDGIRTHNLQSPRGKRIKLQKVVGASKSDFGSGSLYFILLKVVDRNGNSDTYYSINKVLKPEEIIHTELFSEPLKNYPD